MKILNIYFGKQNDSPLGWGGTADTVKCEVPDNFDPLLFMDSKWCKINLPNGYKYINTANILWFDIVDKEEENKEAK